MIWRGASFNNGTIQLAGESYASQYLLLNNILGNYEYHF